MRPSSPASFRPSDFPSRLARLGEGAFGAVAVVAVTVLWGWALDLKALRDFGAAFPALAPAGALAYLLVACSFFSAGRVYGEEALRHRRAARIAAFLAGLIAVLAL